MTEGRDSAEKYRFFYDTVFGEEFEDIEASGIDEAERLFWDHHCPDLVQIRQTWLPDRRDFERLGRHDGGGNVDFGWLRRHDEGGEGSDEGRAGDLHDAADGIEGKCPKEVVPGGPDEELCGERDLHLHPGRVFACVKDKCRAFARKRDQV